jgi:hypothetical protein
LDKAHQLVGRDKARAQVDIIEEDQLLDADAILATSHGRI